MRVLKIINNNIVSCVDDTGCELVVMGRGLGFGTKPGMEIQESAAEKIFHMDSQRDTDRLTSLLATLPTEQIDLCTRIIEYATQTLDKRMNKNVYLTLTDHVCFALSRIQQGMVFNNALLTEVRIFYPHEFAIGKHALELIKEELHVEFPEDEAASIALHLVNAEYDTSFSETMHIIQALHEILGIIHTWPTLQIRKHTLYYDELTIHLKFLVMRIFSNEKEPCAESQFVWTIQQSFPREYACAHAVARYLERVSKNLVSEEKIAYLTVHIRRANEVTK